MSFSRRQFVRAGAVGAAGMVSASCKWWCPWCEDSAGSSSSLQIAIKGLIIVERLPQAVAVHLVDSGKAGAMLEHLPYLVVPEGIIESSNATSTKAGTDR